MIFLTLLLSKGLMLLNDGLFNDDWTVFNHTFSETFKYCLQSGLPFPGILYVTANHPLLSRWIIFLSLYVSAILFYKICLKFCRREALLLTLFFVTYPVNFAQVSIAMLPRMICQMLFLGGVYLAVKNQISERSFK